MILKKAIKLPQYGDRKEIERFSFFPTKLRRRRNDSGGEIIWLEKYVLVKSYNYDQDRWDFHSSERLSVYMLNKLEEVDCDEKDCSDTKQCISSGVGYQGIALVQSNLQTAINQTTGIAGSTK